MFNLMIKMKFRKAFWLTFILLSLMWSHAVAQSVNDTIVHQAIVYNGDTALAVVILQHTHLPATAGDNVATIVNQQGYRSRR